MNTATNETNTAVTETKGRRGRRGNPNPNRKQHLHVRDRGGHLISANAVRSMVQKQMDKKVIKELATTIAIAVNDAVRDCKYQTEVVFPRVLDAEELASVTKYLNERNFEMTGSKTEGDATTITVSWANAVEENGESPEGQQQEVAA